MQYEFWMQLPWIDKKKSMRIQLTRIENSPQVTKVTYILAFLPRRKCIEKCCLKVWFNLSSVIDRSFEITTIWLLQAGGNTAIPFLHFLYFCSRRELVPHLPRTAPRSLWVWLLGANGPKGFPLGAHELFWALILCGSNPGAFAQQIFANLMMCPHACCVLQGQQCRQGFVSLHSYTVWASSI